MAEGAPRGPVDPLRRSYDETPYEDQHYPLFDLDHLIGLSRLFGLGPASGSSDGVRVLDLGCASGLHLRDQGRRYPDARFTGVDFSETEIEQGRKQIAELQLDNVELVAADLRELEIEAGAFDFVLCHGVFSWVPDEVKERILLICREALAPGGAAAIAYLTYPGWKQREAVRELLSMRAHTGKPVDQRTRESALLLRVLQAGYGSRDGDPHAPGLLAIVEDMLKSPINAFTHDELGEIHDPCYFMQFAEWAGECGLAYLCEADLGTMSLDGLDPGAQRLVGQLSPNALETQQLVDFVVNRSGRSSLLVRSDAEPLRSIGADVVEGLRYASRWWKVTPLNAPDDAPRRYESSAGRSIETRDPALRALLDLLCGERLQPFGVGEIAAALERVGAMDDGLIDTISGLIVRGVIEPRA
jgi:SAM-dependent methyltransferase